MLRVEANENLVQEMERDLGVAVRAAAYASADLLKERLSSGYEERTGRKYKKYPRVSSALGEYPQEQFGKLRDSVAAIRLSDGEYGVGFFNEDTEKLMYLEYTGKGRRMPLFMHFEGDDSTETLEEMEKAVEGSR